ncbi:MAG: N-6 DNA methylase [Phycisphaerales bacterium]|nr:N-6 DNA methylase [Phycisphaerales bacterium]
MAHASSSRRSPSGAERLPSASSECSDNVAAGPIPTPDEFRARVIKAVETLGSGFLAHPDNGTLRNHLASHDLTARSFYEQLIIIAFRYLFLRIADDLRLPHTPSVTGATSGNNAAWKEFMHACHEFAARNESRAQPHHTSPVCLWSDLLTPDLTGPDSETDPLLEIDNQHFSRLVKTIANESRSPGAVDIGRSAIPSAHLGYAYEALLALEPLIDAEARTFSLRYRARNKRKATGSFYTPALIVENLLESALEPIISSRIDGAPLKSQESALLGITVCDPSCGTGNFLIAAARRLAHRLAQLRSGEHRPDADALQAAFCDVIRECIFGVDINPIAVELCKHALWIESRTDPSVVRSIDRHIKVGNALLGATPELIKSGIPDGSCRVSANDRAHSVSELATPTRRQRTDLIDEADPSAGSSHHARLIADTWCASFMWRESGSASAIDLPHDPTTPSVISDALFQSIRHDPESIASSLKQKIGCLAARFRFFHWQLEFPEVFQPTAGGRSGGFDVVIGNPPFLNQLKSDTASDRRTASMLSAITGGAARAYSDLSTAFLLLGVRLCRPGGRVALLEPMSFLSSRDSAPARASILRDASLAALWVSETRTFPGASVFICAPTLECAGPRARRVKRSCASEFRALPDIEVDMESLRGEESWGPLAAAALAIPEFSFDASGVVGDHADATADFRDQYYGLDGFIVESSRVPQSKVTDSRYPPIVTAGLIDLAACQWGDRHTRILKRPWAAPRIDRACMERQGDLAGWLSSRLIPKIILATQTKIIEVFVDEPGRLLPSLPLITVVPKAAADIWAVAAALASPVSAALAMQRHAGSALSPQAIKLSAKQAMRLPVPIVEELASMAARTLQRAQAAPDSITRHRLLLEFARSSTEAYRVPTKDATKLIDWWSSRL